MDVSSVHKICQHLISSAVQRCLVSEDLCRVSILLKSSSASDPPGVRISISDTGSGSNLEEFRDLKYKSTGKWDGELSVTTTSISDIEIYHYHFMLKEVITARRLMRLPSNPKNGVQFSGTEVSLSTSESIDDLKGEIICFFRKMLILRIPKVAIELVIERNDCSRPLHQNRLMINECIAQTLPLPNIERLRLEAEDYVLKHGNFLDMKCQSCFSRGESLKTGIGIACGTENQRNSEHVMEAVIIITEVSADSTCHLCSRARPCSTKTELLYFKDFSPCSISQSTLKALTSIEWKSYGLTLKSIEDLDGCLFLEWEKLPSCVHIDIVLHGYQKQFTMLPARQKIQLNRNLVKKAVKLALDDLKEKYKGILLSAHALKIRSYAPDLARSMTGLIFASKDMDFQSECFSLLGLQSLEIKEGIVEDCIKEKIIKVIDGNDKKPQKAREAAPFLFEDCSNGQNEEYNEEGEEDEGSFIFMDQ